MYNPLLSNRYIYEVNVTFLRLSTRWSWSKIDSMSVENRTCLETKQFCFENFELCIASLKNTHQLLRRHYLCIKKTRLNEIVPIYFKVSQNTQPFVFSLIQPEMQLGCNFHLQTNKSKMIWQRKVSHKNSSQVLLFTKVVLWNTMQITLNIKNLFSNKKMSKLNISIVNEILLSEVNYFLYYVRDEAELL